MSIFLHRIAIKNKHVYDCMKKSELVKDWRWVSGNTMTGWDPYNISSRLLRDDEIVLLVREDNTVTYTTHAEYFENAEPWAQWCEKNTWRRKRMKTHIYKLMRRTSFDQLRVYYLEGTKADLFTLIGYMYSCYTEGTERIDYKTVPAFEPQAPNMAIRQAHSEDFWLYYYEDTSCWEEEYDCDNCKYCDVVLTEEPCLHCSNTNDKWERREETDGKMD